MIGCVQGELLQGGHVHISRSISKLGADIPSVNLPPVATCRADAPCRSKCYARKGRFAFQRNKSLLRRNLDLWQQDPLRFEMDVLLAANPSRFFRWHSAGDIPCASYLSMMVNVAEKCPNTKFLCFTKKFEIVNDYLNIHRSFPENLCVVFSAWGEFLPPNPHKLPVAYVRFKHQQTDIPPSAFSCSGYCGECCATGHSCWELKSGESVVFNEH